MAKFNKLSLIMLINSILFVLIRYAEGESNDYYSISTFLNEAVEFKNSNEKNDQILKNRVEQSSSILHRVKRKGIGSFFGAKSKTTPNNYGYSSSMYGPSGELSFKDFDGSSKSYGPNYHHDPATNLYYLIVSCVSFGVLMYCCYQCRPQNRELLNEYRFRQLASVQQPQLEENQNNLNDDSYLDNSSNRQQPTATLNNAVNINNYKLIFPTAPPLDPQLSSENESIVQSNSNSTTSQAQETDLPNYIEQLPPTYEEALKLNFTRNQSTN